jgi:hypothetical protein
MLRPENRCGPAALASADSNPALTSGPLRSSERKRNPASGGADAGQNSALGAGGKNKRAVCSKHSQCPIVPPPTGIFCSRNYLPKSR